MGHARRFMQSYKKKYNNREDESLTADFWPAKKNRGGSPAWAPMVKVKGETFCDCIPSKHYGNNHGTRFLLLNGSKG